jgi:hypothetical protein
MEKGRIWKGRAPAAERERRGAGRVHHQAPTSRRRRVHRWQLSHTVPSAGVRTRVNRARCPRDGECEWEWSGSSCVWAARPVPPRGGRVHVFVYFFPLSGRYADGETGRKSRAHASASVSMNEAPLVSVRGRSL